MTPEKDSILRGDMLVQEAHAILAAHGGLAQFEPGYTTILLILDGTTDIKVLGTANLYVGCGWFVLELEDAR